MTLRHIILLIVAALALGTAYLTFGGNKASPTLDAIAPANGEPDRNEHAEEGEHEEGQQTTITPEAAKAGGIEVEEAGPRPIRQSLPLTGKIILNPNTSAEIKARFPGIFRKVEKTVGQSVRKGEPLAYVESNDSLQTYAVVSPLSGTVLSRHASIGDTASDEAMFTVADLSTVVAEFHVFPKDITRIQSGQTVEVQSIDAAITADGTVTSLLPLADTDTQTVLAWVQLTNDDGRWRPGMAVQGGAVVEEEEVPLAVKTAALQSMDDAPVVFVREGTDTYEIRQVSLGRSDGTHIEITAGLEPGELVVSKNSFLVKADIGKAGAAHEH